MLADSYIVPECVYGPGSFGGLMALYESNYIRLMHLLETTKIETDIALCSISADDEDLYLSVESSSRYTQVLRLTYQFDEPGGLVADPDLCIRVYLDARMTEVVSWAEHHRHEVLRDLQRRVSRQVSHCWRRNMVLSKWLDFLLDKGHSFQSVNRCRESADRVATVR
jgi:uncharacterized protein YqiB (DUF1249 family)